MKYYLISEDRLSEVAQDLFDGEEISHPLYMEMEAIIIGSTAPIQWLPIDPANPIPKPTNERQVLQLYKPEVDNEQSLRGGYKSIATFPAAVHFLSASTRPLSDLFYWDSYDWRSDDTKDQTIEEGWLEIGYTMYCIFESPKPTQP